MRVFNGLTHLAVVQTSRIYRMHNKDAQLQFLDDVYSSKVFPTTLVYNVAAALGGLANIVVILVYCFRIQRETHRYYIPVMSAVDFTGCVINAFYFHLVDSHHFDYPSDLLCRILSFMVIFNNGVSGHIILVIALQRYLILCHPFGKQLNRTWRRASLVIIIMLSVVYGSPTIYASGTSPEVVFYDNQNSTRETCTFVSNVKSKISFQRGYFGFLLAVILLNIVITAGLYFPVIRKVYRSIARLEETTFPDNRAHETPSESQINDEEDGVGGSNVSRARLKHNMSVTVLFIIVAYIVSFLPSLFTQTLVIKEPEISDTVTHINLYHFFLRFYIFNHILNPFIYIGFDMKFRKEFKIWICSCECRK